MEDKDPPPEISEDTCIMKTQNVEVVTVLPHRIQDQIAAGKTISKNFIADKHTLIVTAWSYWFIKITEEWNQENQHRQPQHPDEAHHYTQNPVNYLIDKYKYMWEHLVDNFDFFNRRTNINNSRKVGQTKKTTRSQRIKIHQCIGTVTSKNRKKFDRKKCLILSNQQFKT